MEFDTKLPEKIIDPVVVMMNKNENGDLDLYFDGVLVGYWSDGKMWTIQYQFDNSAKLKLEKKGVKFVERKNNIGWRIDIDL